MEQGMEQITSSDFLWIVINGKAIELKEFYMRHQALLNFIEEFAGFDAPQRIKYRLKTKA